ncbi:MAG: hypothetical protein IJS90_08505, partial [Clostridia bacterium]|nr:hypothetical protein [Clostridia bacterium]
MKDISFKDVYYQPSENPAFCYRSGMTVYEEVLYKGVLCASGWNTAGYPLNVLSNCPSRIDPREFSEPYSFRLEIDSSSVHIGLKPVDFSVSENEGRTKAELTLESAVKPVRITVNTVLDGTAVLTRYLEIKNLSDEPLAVGALSLISGGLEVMDRSSLSEVNDPAALYSSGYFDFDTWGREGAFSWHDLSPGAFSVNTRFGSDRFRHPLIFIRNNITGKIWFVQTAFSGGCGFELGLRADKESKKSALSFSADITGYKPLYVIPPKGTFVSPEIHIGAVNAGLDEAVNEMHAHIRKSALDMPEAKPGSLLVGAG